MSESSSTLPVAIFAFVLGILLGSVATVAACVFAVPLIPTNDQLESGADSTGNSVPLSVNGLADSSIQSAASKPGETEAFDQDAAARFYIENPDEFSGLQVLIRRKLASKLAEANERSAALRDQYRQYSPSYQPGMSPDDYKLNRSSDFDPSSFSPNNKE